MLSAHIKNNYLWKGGISKWKTLIVLRPEMIFPQCYDSPNLTMLGQENSSAQPGGVADDGNLTSTQAGGRRFSFTCPLFSFDYKTLTH